MGMFFSFSSLFRVVFQFCDAKFVSVLLCYVLLLCIFYVISLLSAFLLSAFAHLTNLIYPQIQIPLTSASPTSYDTSIPLPPAGGPGSNAASMILPLQHLTPRTLLGAGGEERERVGHLYASQIGSMILGRNPEERRGILVGLGFAKIGEGRDSGEREAYFDLLELIGAVL